MQTVFVVSLYGDIRIEQILLGGPMGILGPMLIVLLCLWLGRGERSPWYVKAVFIALLAVLLLIVLGAI